jgi:hypothetical protein
MKFVWLGVACVAYLAGVFALSSPSARRTQQGSEPPAAEAATNGSIILTCFCVYKFEDVYSLVNAMREGDAEAIEGLVRRNKAITLEKDVKVRFIDRYSGMATVSIESGFHSGENCKLPESFIQPAP